MVRFGRWLPALINHYARALAIEQQSGTSTVSSGGQEIPIHRVQYSNVVPILEDLDLPYRSEYCSGRFPMTALS